MMCRVVLGKKGSIKKKNAPRSPSTHPQILEYISLFLKSSRSASDGRGANVVTGCNPAEVCGKGETFVGDAAAHGEACAASNKQRENGNKIAKTFILSTCYDKAGRETSSGLLVLVFPRCNITPPPLEMQGNPKACMCKGFGRLNKNLLSHNVELQAWAATLSA